MNAPPPGPSRHARLAFATLLALSPLATAEPILPGLEVVAGPVNGAFIHRAGKTLAVYGDPRGTTTADTVLFTHHRRDVVWAGRALVERGARAVVPARERDQFTGVAAFWTDFRQARFHDYAQQTTKVLTQPLAVAHAVEAGEVFVWEGLPVQVLDAAGPTRGSLAYLVKLGGRNVAFTGDLICGDGRLWDLYSLQDAIPEAGIRGYHGYAARLGPMMASLDRLAAAQPDLLVPARGPLIHDPAASIARLQSRIRALYANVLSIDALRWYFGDAHIEAKARRVLGPDAKIDWMPTATTVQKQLPDWLTAIDNTRLLRAANGAGFVIDCGSRNILNALQQRHRTGTLRSLDHVFITHYHDDHTDAVPDLVSAFGSTVYACPLVADVLERPAAYRLPAMTARPIPVSARLTDGASWRWQEFELTAYDFPGQTENHQALLVRRDGGESLCFIGDSFTPSGIDDYCLLNRNLLHPRRGYFACLDRLKQLPADCLLVNQHVGPAFRFSPAQLARMESTLKERVDLLRALSPWDDPNFALDEGWARFRPYAAEARPGATLHGAVVLMNHSPETQAFRVRLNLPPGWTATPVTPDPVRIPPRQEGAVHFAVTVPDAVQPGLQLVTADVAWNAMTLREWTELLVEVGAPTP